MRQFSSYGPVNKKLHFYVPREDIVQKANRQIIGDDFNEGGHYITVWGPRQSGKTWIMREVLWGLQEDGRLNVVKLNVEDLKTEQNVDQVAGFLAKEISNVLQLKENSVNSLKEFGFLFTKDFLKKPLILIIDEFDALGEDIISGLVSLFRNIHIKRAEDKNPSPQKEYLLHGVALVGVRSVVGVENVKGSPFNVQRSLRIPNLSFEEVDSMFKWYEKESGQKVEPDVIGQVFYETQGQPGLVSWFGELLTQGYEGYAPDQTRAITLDDFEDVHADAIDVLPNNNILNIISKARLEPHKDFVLEMFRTGETIPFKFDDACQNFLYMNGLVDWEKIGRETNVKFSCPFVQKRLFNCFSHELFSYMGKIYEPFEDVSHIVTADGLNVVHLIRRYENHLRKNREWMLKDAPTRSDLRIYEAVFHFNLYEYLVRFFGSYKTTNVWPEFPTGNGKIDLMIKHGGQLYALEVKSYKDEPAYHQAVQQAARYGKSLNLDVIYLVVFVERVPDDVREKYEGGCFDEEAEVRVMPVFVAMGE